METARPADQPATIPVQPRPIATIPLYLPGPDRPWSVFARRWPDGMRRGDCRLCDECKMIDGVCLVAVNRAVAVEDMPLFSLAHHRAATGSRPLGPVDLTRKPTDLAAFGVKLVGPGALGGYVPDAEPRPVE